MERLLIAKRDEDILSIWKNFDQLQPPYLVLVCNAGSLTTISSTTPGRIKVETITRFGIFHFRWVIFFFIVLTD